MAKKDDPNLPLLTPQEAAELLHVQTETILTLIDRKELLAFKVGPYWRIRRDELIRWDQHHDG